MSLCAFFCSGAMCPNSRKSREKGNDQRGNVPELEEKSRERERSERECARTRGKVERKGTIREGMCPNLRKSRKKGNDQRGMCPYLRKSREKGNDQRGNVPEFEEKSRERERSERECARTRGKVERKGMIREGIYLAP